MQQGATFKPGLHEHRGKYDASGSGSWGLPQEQLLDAGLGFCGSCVLKYAKCILSLKLEVIA